MSDRPIQDDSDDETLSAYLAAELDDAAADAFEQRLLADPALARRADALAQALVALGAADAAEPPAGFDAALRERLPGATTTGDDLAARREQRARRRGWWTGAATAAAVLLLGMVMTFGPFLSRGGGGHTTAGVESAEMAQTEADAAGPLNGPVLVAGDAAVDGQRQLRRRFSDLPEVRALLGTDVDEVLTVAQAYTDAVPEQLDESRTAALSGSGAAQAGGAAPEAPVAEEGDEEAAGAADGQDDVAASGDAAEGDAADTERRDDPDAEAAGGLRTCLDTITAGAQAPLVPVRVETLRYEGQRAIAYVFVTASPDSDRLDRTEVWVVARADCATLVFQQS